MLGEKLSEERSGLPQNWLEFSKFMQQSSKRNDTSLKTFSRNTFAFSAAAPSCYPDPICDAAFGEQNCRNQILAGSVHTSELKSVYHTEFPLLQNLSGRWPSLKEQTDAQELRKHLFIISQIPASQSLPLSEKQKRVYRLARYSVPLGISWNQLGGNLQRSFRDQSWTAGSFSREFPCYSAPAQCSSKLN